MHLIGARTLHMRRAAGSRVGIRAAKRARRVRGDVYTSRGAMGARISPSASRTPARPPPPPLPPLPQARTHRPQKKVRTPKLLGSRSDNISVGVSVVPQGAGETRPATPSSETPPTWGARGGHEQHAGTPRGLYAEMGSHVGPCACSARRRGARRGHWVMSPDPTASSRRARLSRRVRGARRTHAAARSRTQEGL